ncbi:MAG: hypothetical protein S4CHLAM20_04370 [Chlamydiia bacterium]|nr:hypothetical protein [Chlamydiia bacterium]
MNEQPLNELRFIEKQEAIERSIDGKVISTKMGGRMGAKLFLERCTNSKRRL